MKLLNDDIEENELISRFEYMRIKRGISKTKCADSLNISRATLYRRLEKPSKLNLKELINLRNLFEVECIDEIFTLDQNETGDEVYEKQT